MRRRATNPPVAMPIVAVPSLSYVVPGRLNVAIRSKLTNGQAEVDARVHFPVAVVSPHLPSSEEWRVVRQVWEGGTLMLRCAAA